MKNIIICAAKTGGHIFPALSFSKEALKNNNRIKKNTITGDFKI